MEIKKSIEGMEGIEVPSRSSSKSVNTNTKLDTLDTLKNKGFEHVLGGNLGNLGSIDATGTLGTLGSSFGQLGLGTQKMENEYPLIMKIKEEKHEGKLYYILLVEKNELIRLKREGHLKHSNKLFGYAKFTK